MPMNVNQLVDLLANACYAFLTINFFWGLYQVILGYRRVKQLGFAGHDEQKEFLDEVLPLVRDGRYEAVTELTADDDRALPQLTQIAVENRALTHEQLRQVVTEVVQRDVMGDLDYRTSWVATVIKSAPLLGLFGTVLGMIGAFSRISAGEKVQPPQIADEISVALITTAMGLATAIPFNFMLNGLNSRIRSFQDGLSAGLVRVLDTIKRTP
jgi:biopolymer transport protein ExbB/TolQ